jgi:hypothetical protein
MKKLLYFVYGIVLFLYQTTQSQVLLDTISESSKKRMSSQIIEAAVKTPEFNGIVRYYYYPNLSAYFDMRTSKYIFKEDGAWIKKNTIAPNYRGYSIYNNYKVQITDYFGDTPNEFINEHKKRFPPKYKGRFPKESNSTN